MANFSRMITGSPAVVSTERSRTRLPSSGMVRPWASCITRLDCGPWVPLVAKRSGATETSAPLSTTINLDLRRLSPNGHHRAGLRLAPKTQGIGLIIPCDRPVPIAVGRVQRRSSRSGQHIPLFAIEGHLCAERARDKGTAPQSEAMCS